MTRPTVTASAFHALPRQEIELRFSEDVGGLLFRLDMALVNVATGLDVPANFQLFFATPRVC